MYKMEEKVSFDAIDFCKYIKQTTLNLKQNMI